MIATILNYIVIAFWILFSGAMLWECYELHKYLKWQYKPKTKETVKRTERGWPGHYICAERCIFRRNTLLEYADYKIVVSTVGRLKPVKGNEWERIGASRYYETFVSKADNTEYHDMDLSQRVFLYPSQGVTWHLNNEDELLANQMHEDAVKWVSQQMLRKAIVFEEDDVLPDWDNTSYEKFIKDKPQWKQ